jgi:hypothetical protein
MPNTLSEWFCLKSGRHSFKPNVIRDRDLILVNGSCRSTSFSVRRVSSKASISTVTSSGVKAWSCSRRRRIGITNRSVLVEP